LIIALASPDGFVISSGRGFTANGPSGGPFNISTQTLLLANSGASSLNWALGGAPAWLDVSSHGGAISPGGTPASVTLNLNPLANTMAAGVYTANLWFTNLTSGLAQLRQFTLQVEQNLVHDGGFESGDFCYWTLSGLDALYFNFVDNGGYTFYNAHSGIYFAALGQSNSLAYLSQPLSTLAGQPYLISFWLQNQSGQTPNQFVVEWDADLATNILYNQLNLGTFEWENMQFRAVAPTNTTLLQFGSRNDNDYFVLDDISVFPVPLPTIQSIQQAGQTVGISASALPGLVYQVQYTTNLFQPQWTNLGNSVTATGDSVTVSENIGADTQEFYRMVLLP
jgi:hypothetical protein